MNFTKMKMTKMMRSVENWQERKDSPGKFNAGNVRGKNQPTLMKYQTDILEKSIAISRAQLPLDMGLSSPVLWLVTNPKLEKKRTALDGS